MHAPGANEKWVTWGPGDEPKLLGPRVWACVECSRGLRPGTNPDGVRVLSKITRHMLANDCWGGMMDPRIAALTPLALMFLLVLRTVRRRWYSWAGGSMKRIGPGKAVRTRGSGTSRPGPLQPFLPIFLPISTYVCPGGIVGDVFRPFPISGI